MKIKFVDSGHSYEADAEYIKGQIWIHFQGRTFVYENEGSNRRSKKHQGPGDGSLIAPMPGKITRILKNVNDKVTLGDAVIVMEAMKMEYTLKADRDGEIVSISCQPGDQVILGKKLAQIKGSESNG
jgi:biotin carboxyl carrier protein